MYHKEGALIRIEHVHKYTFLVFIALSRTLLKIICCSSKMICCGSKLLPVFRPKWSKNFGLKTGKSLLPQQIIFNSERFVSPPTSLLELKHLYKGGYMYIRMLK